MTVLLINNTRTNWATNPSVTVDATNWGWVSGTGGTAAGARNAGTGYSGVGFYRVAWAAATTAISGGLTYTQTGLAAATTYTSSLWVRSSVTQSVALTGQFQDSTATNVGSPITGATVALTAGLWARVSVTGTSGTGVDRMVLTAAATSALWASGDTFDGDAFLIEASAVLGGCFDGATVSAASVMYAWTGPSDASTSTATTYIPQLSLVGHSTFDPCPRVEITITNLAPTTSIVNVWRTADGEREAVRSARRRSVTGADYVVDYEVPFGRAVQYDLEILTGVSAQAVVVPQTVTVNSDYWCIQDSLIPSSAIAIDVSRQDSSHPYLTAAAVKQLEYAAGTTIIPILGSSKPVALMGQRSVAAGVDFSMFTNTAGVTTKLRNLIQQTSLLLVRSNGARNDGIPGLVYYAAAKPVEHPVTVSWGGTLTNWQLTGDSVAAPSMNVLVPIWTYGKVQALWVTYQQAQTTLAGKSYLDVNKSPSGV